MMIYDCTVFRVFLLCSFQLGTYQHMSTVKIMLIEIETLWIQNIVMF